MRGHSSHNEDNEDNGGSGWGSLSGEKGGENTIVPVQLSDIEFGWQLLGACRARVSGCPFRVK